jgi:putative membrane protein insertion efficiency factor
MNLRSLPSKIGIFSIRFYQFVFSPLLGRGKCRFYPTCSEYAAEALQRYGLFLGSLLAVRRLLRCGPWSAGGCDPVPEPEEIKARIWFGRFFKSTKAR